MSHNNAEVLFRTWAVVRCTEVLVVEKVIEEKEFLTGKYSFDRK